MSFVLPDLPLSDLRTKLESRKLPEDLPFSDLRTKLESRHLPEVQTAAEESCSLSCAEDEKMEWESLDEEQIHKSVCTHK